MLHRARQRPASSESDPQTEENGGESMNLDMKVTALPDGGLSVTTVGKQVFVRPRLSRSEIIRLSRFLPGLNRLLCRRRPRQKRAPTHLLNPQNGRASPVSKYHNRLTR